MTLTPGKMKSTDVAAAPKLPDVRGCCVAAGVNHYGCVDKLCDPTKTFEIAVSWGHQTSLSVGIHQVYMVTNFALLVKK